VAELVARAVAVCDPDEHEDGLGRLQAQLEDDDEPITAVENLEERLALAVEGADYALDDPVVSVASAVALYLARQGGRTEADRDPQQLMHLAVRAHGHGDPPTAVTAWLDSRGVKG
jgi:hypothetical protein